MLEIGRNGRALLPPIEFSVGAAESWALVGRNGSGKSTLLLTLVGALRPVGGTVRVGEGHRIGFVAQRSTLDTGVPGRVIDWLLDGCETGWSFASPGGGGRRREAALRAAADAGIDALLLRPLYGLSEGQKQRAMIARGLVNAPTILLLDEPTSALDRVAELDILSLLARLREERGVSVVMVSHHMELAAQHAQKAILLDRESGTVEVGTATGVFGGALFASVFGVPDGARASRAQVAGHDGMSSRTP